MKIRIILFCLMAVISGCRHKPAEKMINEIPGVTVVALRHGNISIPVHSTGTLASSEELKLSFKTGGIISTVKIKEGQKVKSGQVLASLNLSEINAAVTQAQDGYDKALRDYNRAENLYRDTVATLEQKQNASTALEIARTNLDIARFNLLHSTIIAPDDGIILKQLARQNELVSAGYPVFLFGSSGKYWRMKTGLSDREVVKINSGDSAVVSFDAYPGARFPAVIDQVSQMADPYTGTYPVELLVRGKGYRLASGFVAAVDIIPSHLSSFIFVPVGSVVEANGDQGYIFCITDSSRVRKIRIKIENLTDSLTAVSGIPPDISEVVSGGAAYLRDGEKVSIKIKNEK